MLSALKKVRRTLRARRAELRTVIARRFRRAASLDERLRDRIRKRINALGTTYEDGNSNVIGHTYHPIYFPEFRSVPAHRAACESRLGLIVADLELCQGDWILDVGANVGYFAFGLADRGAIVEAYESESDTFEIGAALARLHDANVLYVNRAMSMGTLPLLRPRYRATLLLSVFHWIIKQEGEEQAVKVLQDLVSRSERLYFEVPCISNDAMFRHPWFSSYDSVQAFFKRELPLCEIVRLGDDEEWAGRVLWRIRSKSGCDD